MQGKRHILSIIVPTRNASSTLEKLLQSVAKARRIAESADLRIQLVVQDAESADETCEIVRRHIEPGDVLESRSDSGIYEALNRGARNATSHWVMFMGADDVLELTDIALRLAAIPTDGTMVIVGDALTVTHTIRSRWSWRLFFGHSVNHQACIYQRRVFDTLSYPEHFRLGGDYWLNLRLYLTGAKVIEWKRTAIARFCTTGTSSLNVALGLREENQVRRELLGAFGYLANLVKWLKVNLTRYAR